MAKKSDRMRDGEPGWFATLIGAGVLIAGGFSLGLVAGVVSEEPELVVGHLVGRSEQVAWSGDVESGDMESRDVRESAVALEQSPPRDIAAEPRVPETDSDPEVARAAMRTAELPKISAPPPGTRHIESLPGRDAQLRAGYAVQVGAFADREAAHSVGQRLVERGFDAYVVPAALAGDRRWRVRVGPVERKADAEVLALRLKLEERLPTWVLTEGGG